MSERENEAQLLAECRAGKDAAWGRFYQLFGGYVYSLCRRYGVAETEIVDTVQDVFAQVFLNLASYDPVKGSLKPWVRALAINIVLMHLRKQGRGRIVYLEDYTDEAGLEQQTGIPTTAIEAPRKADNRRVQRSPQLSATQAPKEVSDIREVLLSASVDNSAYANEKVLVLSDVRPEVEALAMLPFRSYSFVAEGDFLPSPQVKTGTTTSDQKQEDTEEETSDSLSQSSGWFIDILAGTQFASATYRGTNSAYAMLRSETETALPGHHFAVGIGKNIGEKWHLRTGIAYDRIRTLTDYEGVRMFDSTFLNVPLRVRLNGDTVYGAAALQVTETRELKSFQREQRLTIPLLIGRNFRLGRSSLAMRAGPEFGLLIGSGGKVLAADRSVRSLSNADFQRLSISARLEGELAVPLGAKGPFLIGRIGLRRVLGGGPTEVQRAGNSVLGGIGLKMPL